MSDTMIRPEETLPETDEPKVAHYARKSDITRAHIEGTPIKALCGKIFVPHRDPSNLPVCPKCKEIYQLKRLYEGKPL